MHSDIPGSWKWCSYYSV